MLRCRATAARSLRMMQGAVRHRSEAASAAPKSFAADVQSPPFERTDLRGQLPEMEHLRGGLGGLAPIHLNVDSRIVHGFRWVSCESLYRHEQVRPEKASALQGYLDTQGGYATIPAIIACSRTNAIVDGHHRHSVIKSMGYRLCPVIYVDYGHHDILVHSDETHPCYGLSKQDVVDAAVSGQLMDPKSTNHVIRAGNGSYHPIVAISPNCGVAEHSTNLTGGWSYKPSMGSRRA